MKKSIFAIAALAGLAITTGCSDDYSYNLEGEGNVVFAYSFSNDVKTASRASAEELQAQLSESAILWISKTNGDNGDGVVRKYNGLANVPADGVKLAGGSYVAELWAGDSVPASFDKKYYKARTPFTISNGSTRVELCGRIANVVTSVNYSADVNDVLSDYSMTISHDRGALTFDDPQNQKGYFMMPSTDKNLTWTLTGRKSDGSQYNRTGVIENAKPCTEYILNVKYTAQSEDLGGGYLDIIIDESEIPVEDNITIVLPPSIQGYGFDIASTIFSPAFGVGRKSVYIAAATATMTSVEVKSSLFTPIIGGDDVDLLNAKPNVVEALNAAGVNWLYTSNIEGDLSNMKLNFEAEFMNKLDLGEYDFVITATDENGNVSSATMHVSISEAKVVVRELAADAPEIWATTADITADITADDAENCAIEYRKKGATDWTRVEPTVTGRAAGDTYTVKLAGLTPGTAYEYRAMCDGFVGTTFSFTTEAAAQVINGGFEDWCKPAKPYLICANESDMYWDSGNHGSSTMNKNVTTPDSEVKHSGNYSAKLATQFVGIGSLAGKLAAGNAFVGEYLGTNGTDGVLGFGRPFASRPKALRLWVKYRPVAVTHEDKTNVPDLPKGAMDEGIVYFALTDGSVMKTYKNKTYPTIVDTADKKFFDAERRAEGDVIAYGEQRFVGNTEGEGLIEFVVPFEYYKQDVKAKYLILCIAASRGGDFFTGGNGTTMWVDDVEFIYE